MADYIFFDLDGTLTDPGEGITNSVAYALRSFGIHPGGRKELEKFIGPPLQQSFERFYGMDEARAQEAVGKYREYYVEAGIFENLLYPGIPQALEALRQNGYSLAIATSKPTIFAGQIARHFAIDGYFDAIAGSELDGGRSNKGDVIAYAWQLTGLLPGGRAVMVGDREHDVIGAREQGMDCLGVLYGYGSREELLQAGAVALAETPEEVAAYFRDLNGG